MNKLCLLIAMSLLLFSCSEQQHPVEAKDSGMSKKDSLRKVDSVKNVNEYLAFLKKINEPDVRTAKYEIYRYELGLFLAPSFMFTVIPDTGYTAKLYTKCVQFLEGRDNYEVGFRNKRITIYSDTLLSESVQHMSEDEYSEFKQILDGSYYWALSNPCPNGDGMTDGDGLVLRAKSKHCMDDSLSYSQIGIHCSRGDFRAACTYLARISKLWESQIAYYRLSYGKYKNKSRS